MKKLIFLLFTITPLVIFTETIPEKLVLSSNAFFEDQSLYPIYRVELIIFLYKKVNKIDKVERFPELNKYLYSNDLIKLLDTPNLLVKKEAIGEGLIPNKQVIKTINLNQELNLIENDKENTEEEKNYSSTPLLPYEYFQLLDKKNLNQRLIKRLNQADDYEVLFHESWFQPLFTKELTSPIYIQGKSTINGTYGELLLYKERFLHSDLRLRLTESTNGDQDLTSINLYNFNNLLKISKAQNRFVSFFISLGEEVVSFSNWILRTKEFTPLSNTEESSLIINNNHKDLYEINQQTKMKEGSYHYIDHPYFGVVIRLSEWQSE